MTATPTEHDAARIDAGVRADVWLWAARFFKTRTLAKAAIAGGKVELNGHGVKPGRVVRAGDRLTITRGEERYVVDVRGVSDTRGPAPVAQTRYAETEDSVAARAAAREQRRLAGAQQPLQRPDKKARRDLRKLQRKADDGLPPWFPR